MFFSLKALKEIKDPQATSSLIEFIKNNKDNLGYVETAMLALSNIGSEAIEPIIRAINADFKKHFSKHSPMTKIDIFPIYNSQKKSAYQKQCFIETSMNSKTLDTSVWKMD